MNKPHKHAEVIKAWADGAKIQYRDIEDGEWFDLPEKPNPGWIEDFEYRVKPELKDPDAVLKEAWYSSLGILVPFSSHQDDAWKRAAIILLKTYKKGELKEIE